MPHFVIECSENIIRRTPPETIMDAVYLAAEGTGLFALNDIKVRIHPYEHFRLGEDKHDFIHVFGHIMEGRSVEQRAGLSRKIVEALNGWLTDVSFVSVNISEFEKATYSNRALIHPRNTTNDRHFVAKS